MIFDAHLHLPCYDDCVTFEDKKRRLLHDLKAAGVCGGIVIADSEFESAIGTTEDCVALFEDTENVFVMAGISPLINYERRLTELEPLLAARNVVAVKLFPGHEDFYMDDPRLDAVFALCERYDVPLATHTGWANPHYNRPHYFAQIAQARPNLRLVICHLCWPDIDQCFEAMAAYPNIYYDISSIAHEKKQRKQTVKSLRRIAEHCADRIILGSDYGMCSIAAHIELVRALKLSDTDTQLILADNALRLYKISLQGDTP